MSTHDFTIENGIFHKFTCENENFTITPGNVNQVSFRPIIRFHTWKLFPPKNTNLIPFLSRRCRVVHEAHGLSQPLLTLLDLTVCCTEQIDTINFCLANDVSRQIAALTHTEQFLAVFTIIQFPFEIDVHFFFVQYRKTSYISRTLVGN